MPRLSLDMTDEAFEAAEPDELVAAIVFRVEYTESLLWAELDLANDRIPGFGNQAKGVVAETLERIAATLRFSSLPNWKRDLD